MVMISGSGGACSVCSLFNVKCEYGQPLFIIHK